jgi:hypothetical protein
MGEGAHGHQNHSDDNGAEDIPANKYFEDHTALS